jgi:hypothetical protein
MLRSLVFAFILCYCTACVGEVNKDPISVEMKLEIENGKVVANLIFLNGGKKEIWLEKLKVGYLGVIMNRAFKVNLKLGSESIEYKGLFVSPAVVNNDRFIKLGIGESIENRVVLSDYYELKPANNTYEVQYNTLSAPKEESDLFILLKSDKVIITF